MGNPGVGKSMVAERMVGIMPAMNNSEKLICCQAREPYLSIDLHALPAGTARLLGSLDQRKVHLVKLLTLTEAYSSWMNSHSTEKTF